MPTSFSIGTTVDLICENLIGRLLFVLSFVVIIMSTADSLLNAVGNMWVHNLLLPLFLHRHEEKNSITLTSLFTLALGVMVTLVVVSVDSSIMDVSEHTYIWVSSLSVSFVMGVLGLKGSDWGFKITLIAFYGFFFHTKWLASMGLLDNFSSLLLRGLREANIGKTPFMVG